MPNDIKRRLLSKPENEQIEELKELYKMQFDKYPPERQQYVLKDLAYKDYEYDVYNLAKYLTNGNQGKSVNFNEPLIRKPSSSIETSILNVEPQVEESDVKEENSNNDNNDNNNDSNNNDNSNNDSSKKVSFAMSDTSSSDSNSNSSSSTTRKITL